jgi:hypothetical protein
MSGQPANDQRRSKRSRVLLTAHVETADGDRAVKVRDLSRHGALLEADEPIAQQGAVVFRRNGSRVDARIVWAAAGRIGLEFLRPITEDEFLVQLHGPARTKAVPAQLFRRPAPAATG